VSRDGRFAPSPTGVLHLGNLRTALLAWLFARSAGARFLVRVEDLDAGRVRPGLAEAQLVDLAALGLDWDGPVEAQSARRGLYAAALASLDVYECFCTRAEIRESASAAHGPPDHYPGTCRSLTASERAARRAAGRVPALRVRAGGTIGFVDRLLGPHSGPVDDFVVRRNDGAFAYNLAVVVDDAEQGVTEVVRGDDLLDTTPRQLLLARLLGLAEPAYAHVPLVLGPDGARLAKRHGAVTLGERRAIGEGPADVLALLARSLGLAGDGERVSATELIGRFDPGRLPRAATVLGGD
jgi:glutamyl-tRNA synthetase